jgi:hypothetical protein
MKKITITKATLAAVLATSAGAAMGSTSTSLSDKEKAALAKTTNGQKPDPKSRSMCISK